MTAHCELHGLAGFPAKYAVALSNFTIVGGAFANLFFNIGRRHSFKQKPLIDWDLILIMEPSTILGAVVGGYLNKVIATELLLVACLLLPTHTHKVVPNSCTSGVNNFRG